MSEDESMDPVQQAPEAALGAATAGVLLKAAREAQGLHIGALAVMLKVPVRKLEALEADRHEDMGDLVFTRALAASVCRVLKMDAAPVMAALPHSEIPRFKTDDAGLNTPFKAGGVVSGQALQSRLTNPLALGVAALLLGALLLVMLPVSKAPDPVSNSALPAAGTELLQAAPAIELAAAPTSAPEPTVLPAAEATPAVAQDGAAVLVLESRGASWVEITDAQGVLQLRRILAAGEQVRSQGPLPLSVVLGRADDVEVRVRGQLLDVSPMTRANVARFEVK